MILPRLALPAGRSDHRRKPRWSLCCCSAPLPSSWHVPPGAFGGISPERAGARQLARFFTHAAAYIVLDQLEALAGGAGSLSRVQPSPPVSKASEPEAETAERLAADRDALARHMQNVQLGDPDAWMEALAAASPRVALRVATTRLAYATEPTGFEWHNLKRVTGELLTQGNAAWQTTWLRDAVSREQEAVTPPQSDGFKLPGLGSARQAGANRSVCAVCGGTGTKPCGQCSGTGINQEVKFGQPIGAPCWLCEGSKQTMCGSCADLTDTF